MFIVDSCDHLTDRALVLGPSPAAIARINNEHRFQILVKYKSEPMFGGLHHFFHIFMRYRKIN
jgi:primosomal protein N'